MLGSDEKPLKVAIVGAGPSGMYVADALFKSKIAVVVHAYDRLPTPYGLLRGGVAPDHQRMKSVSKYYDRVAGHPSFSFFGNVDVGSADLPFEMLREYYDVVVLSYGAETDRSLGIDGETLNGSFAATEFVGWYNGHPDYQLRQFNFNAKSVAIIGQGNVAIDVTRILAKSQEELASSDITAVAMDALKDSQIETIHLIGRRGPVQAAFTQLEIQELGELKECSISVDSQDLVLSDSDELELSDNRKAQKNLEVLKQFSSFSLSERKKKHIYIHFLKSPLTVMGEDHVEGLLLGRNRLEGEPGQQKAKSTGETEKLDVDMVFRSVGYAGIAMPGLPFDDRKGTIPHENGRVVGSEGVISGVYVAGWIKRGPSGVLGSNKPDSTETVQSLLEDLPNLVLAERREASFLTVLKERGQRVVSFDDWQRIDAEEIRRGELVGKPREKFTSLDEILLFLDS